LRQSECLLWAITGLVHRNKATIYSITSSRGPLRRNMR
jgi:hypothetical protein